MTILVRVCYLWAPMSHDPIKFLTRLTFLSFLCQMFGPLLYHYTNFPLLQAIINIVLCPHGTAYYRQLTMTENFLCFFLLDILFHFCFALTSSSYINMCLNVHIHHSQFLVLCFIQSLLEGFYGYPISLIFL